MNGGVRKRGSTWSYYFDLGKVDGKRKKKEKGGFRTKKDAEAALAKAINEYNNTGQVFTPSEITVSDYLDQWYECYCFLNLKPNSIRNYKCLIDKHITPENFQRIIKAFPPGHPYHISLMIGYYTGMRIM